MVERWPPGGGARRRGTETVDLAERVAVLEREVEQLRSSPSTVSTPCTIVDLAGRPLLRIELESGEPRLTILDAGEPSSVETDVSGTAFRARVEEQKAFLATLPEVLHDLRDDEFAE
jgi:hypothetical protein